MQSIYDKHSKAFANVSAFIIVKNGERIGKVAFKHADSVRCFLHIAGAPMSAGSAGGGGYDRATAAFQEAAARHSLDAWPTHAEHIRAIKAAAAGSGGTSWESALRNAGFEVWQAV